MDSKISHGWIWLTLIAISFVALALGATFMRELLNQPVAQGPATWGLVASAGYIVFVIVVMGIAIRPFANLDEKKDK